MEVDMSDFLSGMEALTHTSHICICIFALDVSVLGLSGPEVLSEGHVRLL